jgi:hypothetical protein
MDWFLPEMAGFLLIPVWLPALAAKGFILRFFKAFHRLQVNEFNRAFNLFYDIPSMGGISLRITFEIPTRCRQQI